MVNSAFFLAENGWLKFIHVYPTYWWLKNIEDWGLSPANIVFFAGSPDQKTGQRKAWGLISKHQGFSWNFTIQSVQVPCKALQQRNSRNHGLVTSREDKLWDVHCLKSPNGQQLKHLQLPKNSQLRIRCPYFVDSLYWSSMRFPSSDSTPPWADHRASRIPVEPSTLFKGMPTVPTFSVRFKVLAWQQKTGIFFPGATIAGWWKKSWKHMEGKQGYPHFRKP